MGMLEETEFGIREHGGFWFDLTLTLVLVVLDVWDVDGEVSGEM